MALKQMQVSFGCVSDEVLVYEGATTTVEQGPVTVSRTRTTTGFSFGAAKSNQAPFLNPATTPLLLGSRNIPTAESTGFTFGGAVQSTAFTFGGAAESTGFSFGGGPVTVSRTRTTTGGFSFGAAQNNQAPFINPATTPLTLGSAEIPRSGLEGASSKPQQVKTPSTTNRFTSSNLSGSRAKTRTAEAFGVSPCLAGSIALPKEGESRKSEEKEQILAALFETQLKSLRVQNALQKLLLLRLKNFTPTSTIGTRATLQSAGLSKSPVCQIGIAGSETLGTGAEDVPEGLRQPLEALLQCSGIQIAIQKQIASLLAVPAVGGPGGRTNDGDLLKTAEPSEDERVSEISSQFERIFSTSTYQCDYKQNPYNLKQQNLVDSNDVVKETPNPGGLVLGWKTTRRVPHGRGKLSTVTGEVIYEGQWHKGKRHGTGEALVVSRQSTSPDGACGYYKGTWKNNMRHGHGSMLFYSGAKYDGQWQYDKMSGCGVMRCRDGAIIEGTWCEGLLDGCALFTWPHGVTEYRQYNGNNVLHSCPVDKNAVEDISKRNEQSWRAKLLSARLQELKLEQGSVTDMINNLRSTLRTEMKNLEENLNKINESASNKVAAALHEQEKEYEEKFKSSAAKLREAEANSVKLEMEVKQAIKESRLCQICFDRRRDCMIMPCTHLLYCRQCLAEHKSAGKKSCPACRGPINGEINCNLDF